MRPAKTGWHTEPLRTTDGHVGTEFARRLEQRQRKQVSRHDGERIVLMGTRDEVTRIGQASVRGRVLQHDGEHRCAEIKRSLTADDNLEPDRLGARAQHGDRLRMAILRDEHGVGFVARLDVAAHSDRLGRGCGLVEQRRVGNLHAAQVADHRLKIEQRLKPALRNLGLIRRVLRVPTGVLEEVSLDHRRGDAVVIALPDVRAPNLILPGQVAERLEGLSLALGGRQLRRLGGANAVGHPGTDHGIE